MRTVVEIRESGFRSSGNDVEGFDGLDGFDGADDVDAAGADDAAGGGGGGGADVDDVVVFVRGAIPVGGSWRNKDVGYRPIPNRTG
jgi:hypothetical protein